MELAVSENRDALTVETVHEFIRWTAAVEGESDTVNREENMSNSLLERCLRSIIPTKSMKQTGEKFWC
jgi:hypothetical protein